jgi:hypothetical protein
MVTGMLQLIGIIGLILEYFSKGIVSHQYQSVPTDMQAASNGHRDNLDI